MTFKPTHAQKSPSDLYGFVTDACRPIPEELRFKLGLLDGVERFTYIIWKASDPAKGFVTPADLGDYFMRAAGSADQMTVEVRLPKPDGAGHLYTVGRAEPADGTTNARADQR